MKSVSAIVKLQQICCKHFISIRESFPKQQILYFPKLKKFADDNFNKDEHDRKFYKRIENTVGIGETAGYEQFYFLQLYFQKACTADTS